MAEKLEDKLVREIAKTLSSKFDRIETNRRPYASHFVRECLHSVLGYVPILQPELDMVLWRNSKMIGVEVKVFTPSMQMRSFYEGIGQALALHRFGFDYSNLWLMFLEVKQDDMKRGSTAWEFVRDKMRLPLDFTYFTVETTNGGINGCGFRPMQYDGSQAGYKLKKIDDLDFNEQFKWPNPIRNEYEPKVIRTTLELWFAGALTKERLKDKVESYPKPIMAAPSTAQVHPTNKTSSSTELQTTTYDPHHQP